MLKRKVESKKMITNKNINLQKNIPAMEDLSGSQHKNKNIQMRLGVLQSSITTVSHLNIVQPIGPPMSATWGHLSK